jgi:flagellar biogenesis protein FliO
MTLIRHIFLIAFLALPVFAAETASAVTAVVAPVSAPPSVGASVFRMIGGLCVVVSLAMIAAWAFKNRERFLTGKIRESKLKVLESRSLGARHSICVVAYDNQRLLLSSSPTGVTMLTHLPDATNEETAAQAQAPTLPSFSEAFMHALGARRK